MRTCRIRSLCPIPRALGRHALAWLAWASCAVHVHLRVLTGALGVLRAQLTAQYTLRVWNRGTVSVSGVSGQQRGPNPCLRNREIPFVSLGEPNSFFPKNQSPVVDGSMPRAPAPSSRSIPNNAKHFRTISFSAPNRGERFGSPRSARFLPFLPDFSPVPQNVRAWLTRESSRFTFFEFP